jgi:hypothetical protein
MTATVNLAALYLSGKSLSQAQNQVIKWIKFYMDNRIQDCKYQKTVQKAFVPARRYYKRYKYKACPAFAFLRRNNMRTAFNDRLLRCL